MIKKMCVQCGINEAHDNRSYCKQCNSRMAQESFARRFPTVEERRKYHAERRAATANGSTLNVNGYSVATLQLTGTFSATVAWEANIDETN